MRTSAWCLAWRPSNAASDASIAAASEVPPRGMMPTSIASRLCEKAPKSSVSGHWRKAVPGEGDEADAVAAELRQEVLDRELRAREPVRLDVGREHAPRGVDRDDQVDALALDLLPAEAPHRTGERQRRAAAPPRQSSTARTRRRRRSTSGVTAGRRPASTNVGERLPTPPQAPDEEERERRHERPAPRG